MGFRLPIPKGFYQRNKTYTDNQVEVIYEYLQGNDPQLLLFIKFVSYNFPRPIEVCRLRIGDINLRQKTLSVKAKNKLVKRKIIPEILLRELPDLSKYDRDDFIFAPEGSPGAWNANDDNRRDHFTKRFKAIKDYFNEKAKEDKWYFTLG